MKNLSGFAIVLNPKDIVATVLREHDCGDYEHDGRKITLPEKIPIGFKVALKDIKKGERVFKYGYPIGIATADIKAGEIVHTHNLVSAVNTKGGQNGR